MNRSTDKILLGSIISTFFLWLSQVFGQNLPSVTLQPYDDPNIIHAAWQQVLNNPASLTVIGFLCVLAWLADDLPFINSRYVAHLTVIAGGCTYWLFGSPGSVPKSFPYPFAVLVANGIMCGFAAYTVHRQAIARLISLVRAKNGDSDLPLEKQNSKI